MKVEYAKVSALGDRQDNHDHGGAILVVLAITEGGNFGVFDLHAGNVVALSGEQSLECRPS